MGEGAHPLVHLPLTTAIHYIKYNPLNLSFCSCSTVVVSLPQLNISSLTAVHAHFYWLVSALSDH